MNNLSLYFRVPFQVTSVLLNYLFHSFKNFGNLQNKHCLLKKEKNNLLKIDTSQIELFDLLNCTNYLMNFSLCGISLYVYDPSRTRVKIDFKVNMVNSRWYVQMYMSQIFF